MMLLFLCILSLLEGFCSQTYPSNVLLPTSAITAVSFACTGSPPLQWRVNNTTFHANSVTPPGIRFTVVENDGTLLDQTITVEQARVLSYNGIPFQCSTSGDSFSDVPIAFIIVYGLKFELNLHFDIVFSCRSPFRAR